MPRITGIAVAAGLLATGPAAAEVTVAFVHPQGFTDAGLHRPGPVDAQAPALTGIRRILEREGQRLPPGQVLAIEVLDVDLAGYLPPWQAAARPVRVMEPTTWPRIRLRYALTQDGRRLAGGEEVVADLSYQTRSDAVRSSAPLRFEEAMLREWFAGRFGATRR